MKKIISSSLAAVALGLSAQANTLIDTNPRSGSVSPFGVSNTATYGESVTVPTDNVLNSFSFDMNLPGSLQFKGYVFAWDSANQHATGPALFTSPVTQTSGTGFEQIVFTIPGGLALTTGDQYALFASISEIDGQSGNTGTWGFHYNQNPYTGGSFIFINNGGDESLWTTRSWDNFVPGDLAFTADFSSGTEAVPEVQTWASLAGFAMVGAEVLRRRKAAKA